jgi:hypothetical protein
MNGTPLLVPPCQSLVPLQMVMFRRQGAIKRIRRRHRNRCVAPCLHYKIQNGKFNLIRKQSIIHHFVHSLDQTSRGGHPQQHMVTTSERVVEARMEMQGSGGVS